MWKTIFPPYSEPLELRLLKERLAHVNCKCDICQPTRGRPSDQPSKNIKYTKDIETQSEGYISIDPKAFVVDSYYKNALCPTCCMTLSILRGGVIRVLKDEESETQTSMFSTDQFTDKGIISRERTTPLESIHGTSTFSSSTLCDFLTDSSTDAIVLNANKKRRKRCSEKVTFLESCAELSAKPLVTNDCVCLQDLIDSIRPPLNLPLYS